MLAHKVEEWASFTGPAQEYTFSGLLFDMDGTIIDSTEAIVKHWHTIGKELGVPPETILATSHGRRSIDTLALYDPSKANWEYVCALESQIPTLYASTATEIPGSRSLLTSLDTSGPTPVPWAIVTSGTRGLVTGWLDVMGLAHPRNLVTAEDVSRGKPDAECYVLGRERLGLGASSSLEEGDSVGGESKSDILVLEDAPAGIRAGKAAGFRVVALATTHAISQLKEAGADWIVRDLRSVRLVGWDAEKGRARVEIGGVLVN